MWSAFVGTEWRGMSNKFKRLAQIFAVSLIALGVIACVRENSDYSGSGEATPLITAVPKTEIAGAEATPTDPVPDIVIAGTEGGTTPEPTGAAAEPTEEAGTDQPPADEPKPAVVVFDPGHGAKWAGACYLGLEEKNLTLKVANYARDYLLNNYENVLVYLTREDDSIFDTDIKVDLEMRCQYALEHGADCLVSIHFNATDAHNLSGSEVWASRRSNVHDQTFELGECIMSELEAIGLTRRTIATRKSSDMFDEDGVALDYYAINRHCAARDIPGIIVEQCFMDSKKDQKYISDEDGLRQLGEANARGVAGYLGLEPKNGQQ